MLHTKFLICFLFAAPLYTLAVSKSDTVYLLTKTVSFWGQFKIKQINLFLDINCICSIKWIITPKQKILLKRCIDTMNKKWSNSILAVKMKQPLNYKLKPISRKSKFFQYRVCNPLIPVIYFRVSGMHFTSFLCTQDRFFSRYSLTTFFKFSSLEIEWFLIYV